MRLAVCFGLALLLAWTGRAAAQPAPIKIGLIYSYTGGSLNGGRILDAAIDTYMKQHGDTIAGRKVVIVKRDDTGLAPDVARRLAQELIVQEHVDLLAGTVLTPNTIAVASVSTAAKKPFFVINSATSGIIAKHPYTARFGFTTPQITTPLAHWAYKNGKRTAYAVYQDYGPGIDAAATFQKVFIADGGKMLGEARIPVSATDFSAYIQRIKDTKPDTVFVFLNNNGGAVPFLRGCEQAGVQKAGIKIIATGDLVDENYLPAIGDAALGLVTAFHYSSVHASPANRRFSADFNKLAGGQFVADFGAVQAYDVMDAIYKVVGAQGGNVDPDKTMELVKGMKLDSPRGPMVIDPQTRDPIENVYLRRTEKRGGTLVNVEFETFPMVKDPNES